MVGLFTITIFLGAALLFLVQPMAARMVLPLLGGSPSVWNTCMVFFQALLLAGYAYAHWSVRVLGVRRQVIVHAFVMALPLGLWISGWPPISSPVPPSSGQVEPIAWLLKSLAMCVGPAFLVVSTCGPLVQRWFASTGHRTAKDPYFLYSASNAGSMLALLAYPFIVEPALTLAQQRRLWSVGYIAFVVLSVLISLKARSAARAGETHAAESRAPAIRVSRRLRWIVLAAVPSSFMLGVTQYLSTDIAAIPLLWTVPLAIYLLTFIIAFAGRNPLPRQLVDRAFPILAVAIGVALLLDRHDPIWVIIVLNLLALFFCGILCHGQLAEDRPDAALLTQFYLLIAVGGVLGGSFNSIVAPLAFNSLLEYPIALVAACLMRRSRTATSTDASPSRPAMPRIVEGVVVLGFSLIPVLAAWGLGMTARSMNAPAEMIMAAEVGLPMIACYLMVSKPKTFGLAIGVLLMSHGVVQSIGNEYQKRTFFGIYTANPVSGGMMQLVHGTTLHGLQWMDPAKRGEPLSYYHREGPIGLVFKTYGASPRFDHVALVGLGTGSLTAYGRPGQEMTVFEIDPAVVHLSRDSGLFTFVRDSKASVRFVLGDARLSLAKERDSTFGLIALDAFSSDSVPIHLLTREAMGMYITKLSPGGMLVFHISNRYLDLERVIAGVSRSLGLAAFACEVTVPEEELKLGHRSATWVAVARNAEDLALLRADPRWKDLKDKPGVEWTDDYSSIVPIFELGS